MTMLTAVSEWFLIQNRRERASLPIPGLLCFKSVVTGILSTFFKEKDFPFLM
ncbi:hypothetical protein LCM20_08515 [Halobacillus litoralis]|uniref:hypothetical protein n=1 Tax=Halobacillus litoralis TaxID=45668 RepID=UPI001CD52905|nr:hypothetical protein [Halobacillus litoralis]MCA0970627.1 hypothetical protein [Halobacillus litoralis]